MIETLFGAFLDPMEPPVNDLIEKFEMTAIITVDHGKQLEQYVRSGREELHKQYPYQTPPATLVITPPPAPRYRGNSTSRPRVASHAPELETINSSESSDSDW